MRWTEFGFRGPSADGVARNPLGYFDGIIRPKTPAEFDDDVWIADGPLAGGTICVMRRFLLDVEGFRRALPRAAGCGHRTRAVLRSAAVAVAGAMTRST